MGASTEIDRDDCERFVHRHDEVPRAVDASLSTQRLRDRLAERDADVFDGVVLVHVEISIRVEPEIEATVPGEQLQHVIEEADTRGDLIASPTVETKPHADPRLACPPIDQGAAHSTSSITSMHRFVWSTMPAPIRMQPTHPGSVDRLRM